MLLRLAGWPSWLRSDLSEFENLFFSVRSRAGQPRNELHRKNWLSRRDQQKRNEEEERKREYRTDRQTDRPTAGMSGYVRPWVHGTKRALSLPFFLKNPFQDWKGYSNKSDNKSAGRRRRKIGKEKKERRNWPFFFSLTQFSSHAHEIFFFLLSWTHEKEL